MFFCKDSFIRNEILFYKNYVYMWQNKEKHTVYFPVSVVDFMNLLIKSKLC